MSKIDVGNKANRRKSAKKAGKSGAVTQERSLISGSQETAPDREAHEPDGVEIGKSLSGASTSAAGNDLDGQTAASSELNGIPDQGVLPDPARWFKQFETAWQAVRTRFVGAPPEISSRDDWLGWDNATTLNLLSKRQPGSKPIVRRIGARITLPIPWIMQQPVRQLDFAEAWNETVRAVENLLRNSLMPFAVSYRDTLLHGVEKASIPDPPIHELPPAALRTVSFLQQATGTSDLVAAGTRVFFWCIADCDFEGLGRTEEHRYLFGRWLQYLVRQTNHKLDLEPDILNALRAAWRDAVKRRSSSGTKGSDSGSRVEQNSETGAAPYEVHGNKVHFQGRDYPVDAHLAGWLQRLLESRNTHETLTREVLRGMPGCKGKDVKRELDKLKKLISAEFRKLITSSKGRVGGYYLA